MATIHKILLWSPFISMDNPYLSIEFTSL